MFYKIAFFIASFLLIFFCFIRIEKEINDPNPASKSLTREQNDVHLKIQSLKDKFQRCREMVMKIEGIDCTKENQLKNFETLSKKLVMKRELLQRYKHFSPIDTTFHMQN